MRERFRSDPPELRLEHDLGELVACFHRPSGTTHLLAEPAPELLALLSGRALTIEEIVAGIAQRFAVEDDGADLAERIAARLDELCAAGLVRRETGGAAG